MNPEIRNWMNVNMEFRRALNIFGNGNIFLWDSIYSQNVLNQPRSNCIHFIFVDAPSPMAETHSSVMK